MIISIIGPSGSGKDTQANLIVDKLGIPNISTGTLLRDEAASESELGEEINAVISKGEWVSDDIIYRLLEKRIQQDDAKEGFILNGFPRTFGQIALLDKLAEAHGDELKAVVHFNLSDEVVFERLKTPSFGKS